MAIVKKFKLGNTTIEVDDTYYPKTQEKNDKTYEEFNKIGYKILKEAYYGKKRQSEKELYTSLKN